MKKINFETSKGNFVVVDLPNATHFLKHKGYIVQSCTNKLDLLTKCNKIDNGDTNGFWYIGNTTNEYVLKELTEQQASEIVEEYFSTTTNEIDGFIDYHDGTQTDCPIDSLHSLITSDGYYLFENPYTDAQKYSESKYFDAEDKTFFNPIIFKLV